MNGRDSIGIGVTPHNVVQGLRQNAAEAYLDERVRPANLEIIELATARRLLFRGTRVIGVEVALDSQPVTFWGDQVVLCAGGLGSPHLLLHSGVGPADVLMSAGIGVFHELAGVGHGFMDHPAVHVTYRADAYVPQAGQLTASQVCLNYSSSSGEPDDMRIFPTTYSKGGMLFGMRGQSARERARAAAGVVRPLLEWQGLRGMSARSLLNDVRHRGDLSLYCGLDLESSRGDLTLRSADPGDAPRIVSRYMSEPEDLIRMRECVRTAVDLLGSPQFRQLGARATGLDRDDVADDARLDAWINRHMSTAFHTSRTCRMGTTADPLAVVDQQCRVHGLEGLRVVDVSIMPTLVRRGPNATAVMIGERAAALMDLSLQPPDPPRTNDLRNPG
jgi:choline dehydrogenase-like flavoprotein